MNIDVITVPLDKKNDEKITPDKIVVVVDVLRVCSTIVTSLSNGAEKIFPTLTVKEAFDKKEQLLKKGLPEDKILLGGERKGLKVEGFNMGNSPREYTKENVANKTIIASSTNGTKAMKRSRNAHQVVIGAYLNARAVGKYIENQNKDVLFYLSGREEDFSYEDAVGAGMIIEQIDIVNINKSDAASMALDLYRMNRNVLKGMFKKTVHGRFLISLGLEKDLDYCAGANEYHVVPIMDSDGYIRIMD